MSLTQEAARLIANPRSNPPRLKGTPEQRAIQIANQRIDVFVGMAEEVCRQLGGDAKGAAKLARRVIARRANRRRRANAIAPAAAVIVGDKAERVQWWDTLRIEAGAVVYVNGMRMVCPKGDWAAGMFRTRLAIALMPLEFHGPRVQRGKPCPA